MVPLLSTDDWKDRLLSLVNRGRDKAVFVVGAGLSRDGQGGVLGVSDIVSHIKKAYNIESSAKPAAAAYQDVIGRLNRTVDSEEVEKTIRCAVVASAKDGPKKEAACNELEGDAGNLAACKELQANPSEWYLPKGVVALAELIGHLATKADGQSNGKHPCVLTTNFDGLLELALKSKNVPFESRSIAGDAFVQNLGSQVSVLHLHGYWLDQPTLHEPDSIQSSRGALEDCLKRLLDDARIFVLGYGGWKDVIFNTVSGVFEKQQFNRPPQIVWAFHESNEEVLREERNQTSACGQVLANFSTTIAKARTGFFCGVDAHADLPAVVARLRGPSLPPISPANGGDTASTPKLVRFLAALIDATPQSFRPRFVDMEKAARATKSVNLLDVVSWCCTVLRDARMLDTESARFKTAAWDLITFMAFDLIDQITKVGGVEKQPIQERDGKQPGLVERLPVQSQLFVAILMARRQNVDPLSQMLRPTEPVGTVDDSMVLGSDLFETGPSERDRIVAFERLLRARLFDDPNYELKCTAWPCTLAKCPDPDCPRQSLYGRLAADRRQGRQHYVIVSKGSGVRWESIAKVAQEIAFVERGDSAAATIGINEFELAELIRDFLKLSSTKEIR